MIDPGQFIALLNSEFPEALARIDEIYGRGLLSVEIALFRQATEAALDNGQVRLAEKHFCFIDRVWAEADPQLANAIRVSYLEDFALGTWTPQRHQAVKERMPQRLRTLLISDNDKWR